ACEVSKARRQENDRARGIGTEAEGKRKGRWRGGLTCRDGVRPSFANYARRDRTKPASPGRGTAGRHPSLPGRFVGGEMVQCSPPEFLPSPLPFSDVVLSRQSHWLARSRSRLRAISRRRWSRALTAG